MFVCKDCKAQYKEKPDYCDCGNNTFEEIAEKKPEIQKDFKKEAYSEKEESKGTFWDNYPQIKRFTNSLDVLSTSIFVVCIILSILAWLLIGKEPSQPVKHKQAVTHSQAQVKKKQQIPDLDSFWNNSTPVQERQVKKEKIESPVSEKATPQQEELAPEKISSPFQNPLRKQNPEKKTKNILNKMPPPKQVNKQKPAKRSPSLNDAEVSQYKASLRHLLFSRLAVTSIQGVGKCEVEFSVSPSGKLLNRRFSRLSDNKSLNDAVYNMLMSVPQAFAPPIEYKGEKIRLSFYFNDGYYEVNYR